MCGLQLVIPKAVPVQRGTVFSVSEKVTLLDLTQFCWVPLGSSERTGLSLKSALYFCDPGLKGLSHTYLTSRLLRDHLVSVSDSQPLASPHRQSPRSLSVE